MYKPTHVKNALSAIEKSNQINLIVSNYCRVFSDTNDKSIRTEHIAKTLSLLNISSTIFIFYIGIFYLEMKSDFA